MYTFNTQIPSQFGIEQFGSSVLSDAFRDRDYLVRSEGCVLGVADPDLANLCEGIGTLLTYARTRVLAKGGFDVDRCTCKLSVHKDTHEVGKNSVMSQHTATLTLSAWREADNGHRSSVEDDSSSITTLPYIAQMVNSSAYNRAIRRRQDKTQQFEREFTRQASEPALARYARIGIPTIHSILRVLHRNDLLMGRHPVVGTNRLLSLADEAVELDELFADEEAKGALPGGTPGHSRHRLRELECHKLLELNAADMKVDYSRVRAHVAHQFAKMVYGE